MNGVCLLPSLDRPHLVKRFFEAYTATKATIPVWILIDKNDPKLQEYNQLELPKGCEIKLTGLARTMGDKFRVIWDSVKNMEWIMILNDDHIPKTDGWDQKVLVQLNGTNVIFTNDNYAYPHRICGAITFSGKFLKTLGWIFPPGMHHLYSDDVWGYLCHVAQCAQGLNDVVVEHDHAYKDPSQQDETFKLINGPLGLVNEAGVLTGKGGLWIEDKKVYDHWMSSGQANIDAQKVKDIQPKCGLMLCTLSHDNTVAFDYANGLAAVATAMQRQNIYFEMAKICNSSLIAHSRNALVDIFLKSRCQKLLFIDSDQGFNENDVFTLLNSNKKIIGGITPHKRLPINFNFEPLKEDNHYFQSLTNKGPEEVMKFFSEKADIKGEVEVNRVGTGIMMIDRSVFEIMKDKVDEYEAFDSKPEELHKEYFKMGGFRSEGSKRYRGEDWFFTELAKELKIPIFINGNVCVSHLGNFNFVVNISQFNMGLRARLEKEQKEFSGAAV